MTTKKSWIVWEVFTEIVTFSGNAPLLLHNHRPLCKIFATISENLIGMDQANMYVELLLVSKTALMLTMQIYIYHPAYPLPSDDPLFVTNWPSVFALSFAKLFPISTAGKVLAIPTKVICWLCC